MKKNGSIGIRKRTLKRCLAFLMSMLMILSSLGIAATAADDGLRWVSVGTNVSAAIDGTVMYFKNNIEGQVGTIGQGELRSGNLSRYPYDPAKQEYKNVTDIVTVDNSKIRLNQDSRNLFQFFTSLTNLDGLESWDTSLVKNMYSMFYGCNSLENVNGLANWDVSNVTDARYLFNGCSLLTDLSGLRNWSFGNVFVSSMFSSCSSLTNLNGLENLNVTNTKNFANMFSYCSSLTNIDAISSWNTNNATGMAYMFDSCISLKNLNGIKNWDVSKVYDMNRIVHNCPSLRKISFPSSITRRTTGVNSNISISDCVIQMMGEIQDLDGEFYGFNPTAQLWHEFGTDTVLTLEQMRNQIYSNTGAAVGTTWVAVDETKPLEVDPVVDENGNLRIDLFLNEEITTDILDNADEIKTRNIDDVSSENIVYTYYSIGDDNTKTEIDSIDLSVPGRYRVKVDILGNIVGDTYKFLAATGENDAEEDIIVVENNKYSVLYQYVGHHPSHVAPPLEIIEDIPHGTQFTPTYPSNERGYIFDGWYTDYDCTNAFVDNTPITDHLNLYGRWTRNTTEVAIVTRGAETYYVVATFDEEFPEIDIPEIYGYRFNGYIDETGKAYVDENGNREIWDKTERDAALIAYFTQNTIILNFPDGTSIFITVETDLDTLNLPENPTLEGHEFTGYRIEDSDNILIDENGNIDVRLLDFSSDRTINLESVHDRNLYNIEFYHGDNKLHDDIIGVYHGDAATAPEMDEYLIENDVHYIFLGWTTELKDDLNEIELHDISEITDHATLYAVYREENHSYEEKARVEPTKDGDGSLTEECSECGHERTTVLEWVPTTTVITVVVGDDETEVIATYGETVPELDIPEIYGYTFNGYVDEDGKTYVDENGNREIWDKTDSESTLTAVLTPNVITLNFPDGTSIFITVETDLDTLVLPENSTLEGHEFTGYRIEGTNNILIDENGNIDVSLLDFNSDTVINLETVLTPNVITLNFPDGTSIFITVETDLDTLNLPENPTLEGHEFTGYRIEDSDNILIDENGNIDVRLLDFSSDRTINLESIHDRNLYNVEFYHGDNKLHDDIIGVYHGDAATAPEMDEYLIENDVHYIFLGWTTELKDDLNEIELHDISEITDHATLYAVYAENDHVPVEIDRVDPTCISDGSVTTQCMYCSHVSTQTIEKKNHTFTICDKTHLKEEANCVHGNIYYKGCSGECGLYANDPSFNGQFDNVVWTDGVKDKTKHNYVGEANCQQGQFCTICETYGEPDSSKHFEPYTVSGKKDPTCTLTGYTGDLMCAKGCVIEKGETIKATGHKDDNKDGRCDTCGEIDQNHHDHIDADGDGKCDLCSYNMRTSIDNCGCICHLEFSSNKFTAKLGKVIYHICRAFWKLFKINIWCDCGRLHYIP